ncbi:MAG: alcohol dehydrogenase [Planctomycetota bacterium]|nr:MAG: alcohol dehydrogenase [Planctomycetota bacterium]
MLGLGLDPELVLHENWPEPEPAKGEARLKVRLAGICHTDLELVKGYMGFQGILGHEFVAELEDECLIAGQPCPAGTRVVGEINCAPADFSGSAESRRHCPDRTVLGIQGHQGAFAPRVCLPAENLHRIPDSVSDPQAVFTEPLAAACRILEQVKIEPDTRVAVLGDGKLGLLCSMVLATRSREFVAVGRHPNKLNILTTLGIRTCLLPHSETVADLPADLRNLDVVVEATGNPNALTLACQLLRPQGVLILKTTCAQAHPWNLAPVVIQELTVIGSRCGPFPMALAMLESGQLDPSPLLEEVFPLARGLEALALAGQKGKLKVLLQIPGLGD